MQYIDAICPAARVCASAPSPRAYKARARPPVSSSTIHTHYLAPLDATATKRALMRAQAGLALLLAAVLALLVVSPVESYNQKDFRNQAKNIASRAADPGRGVLSGRRETASYDSIRGFIVRIYLWVGAGASEIRAQLQGLYHIGFTEAQLNAALIAVSLALSPRSVLTLSPNNIACLPPRSTGAELWITTTTC